LPENRAAEPERTGEHLRGAARQVIDQQCDRPCMARPAAIDVTVRGLTEAMRAAPTARAGRRARRFVRKYCDPRPVHPIAAEINHQSVVLAELIDRTFERIADGGHPDAEPDEARATASRVFSSRLSNTNEQAQRRRARRQR
jgi:hypothetical protein